MRHITIKPRPATGTARLPASHTNQCESHTTPRTGEVHTPSRAPPPNSTTSFGHAWPPSRDFTTLVYIMLHFYLLQSFMTESFLHSYFFHAFKIFCVFVFFASFTFFAFLIFNELMFLHFCLFQYMTSSCAPLVMSLSSLYLSA